MRVVPALAPFVQACTSQLHRRRRSAGSRVEIDIVVRREFPVLPVAAEQIAGVEIDNVVGEYEGDVLLFPRAHELMFLAESKDVVANDIFAAVMLVEACAFAAINHVVLQHDAGAPFVRVESPAAVGIGLHIVNQVVAQNGSLLDAQRVNAAHIAQHTLADVVEMIEFDEVVAAGRFLIAPVPADGDGTVEKVVNVIVRDAILAALKNDDAHRRREDASEFMQVIVGDDMTVVRCKRVLPPGSFADANPPRSVVVDLVRDDLVKLTTYATLPS